ncbi:MAG: hypothetical protein AAB873_01865, partial [Patescibacteria group bacterium]
RNKARVAEAARGIIQFEKCPNFNLLKLCVRPVLTGLIESILCASIERAMVCLNLKHSDISGKTDK